MDNLEINFVCCLNRILSVVIHSFIHSLSICPTSLKIETRKIRTITKLFGLEQQKDISPEWVRWRSTRGLQWGKINHKLTISNTITITKKMKNKQNIKQEVSIAIPARRKVRKSPMWILWRRQRSSLWKKWYKTFLFIGWRLLRQKESWVVFAVSDNRCGCIYCFFFRYTGIVFFYQVWLYSLPEW